jgi:ATP-dependent DNA helicase RecG
VKFCKHIRQNNEVGTPFKELQQVLPGLNRNQIQVLMRELKEDGKVACKGKTSAASGLPASDSPSISHMLLRSTCN